MLKQNDLVSNSQWAYHPSFSTKLVLIHLTGVWRKAAEAGEVDAVPGGGGGGVLQKKLGRGARFPYPIYDQNLQFSLPYL